jgi:hypothetical protein
LSYFSLLPFLLLSSLALDRFMVAFFWFVSYFRLLS